MREPLVVGQLLPLVVSATAADRTRIDGPGTHRRLQGVERVRAKHRAKINVVGQLTRSIEEREEFSISFRALGHEDRDNDAATREGGPPFRGVDPRDEFGGVDAGAVVAALVRGLEHGPGHAVLTDRNASDLQPLDFIIDLAQGEPDTRAVLGDPGESEPGQVVKLVQRCLVPGERGPRQANPLVACNVRVLAHEPARHTRGAVEVGAPDDLAAARTEVESWLPSSAWLFSARGLMQGTYICTERAVERSVDSTGRPPKFPRYEGEGSVGRQRPRARDKENRLYSITADDLYSMADSRVRMTPLPDGETRRELARVTFERDKAREQRDAATDREAKALLRVTELEDVRVPPRAGAHVSGGKLANKASHAPDR